MKLSFVFLLIALLLPLSTYSKTAKDYPASFSELTIKSYEKRLSGFAYLAAGKGYHPTILLLHGFPGNEKNLDVAQAMRSQGWNVIFFHYRGSWGSEGEFTFLNSEQDVQVVLQYMHDNADKLRIDKKQISLVGHSMGGHMAIAGILDNASVKCTVAYDSANLGTLASSPEEMKIWAEYSDTLFMLEGWSAKTFLKEIKQHSKVLDLSKRANTINGRPIMFIAADTDLIAIEKHIMPVVSALKATKKSQVTYQVIDDDHSFSSSRAELIDATSQFLNSKCRTR